MSLNKRYRRLVVGSDVYPWFVGHLHPVGVGCTKVLVFRRWGVHGRLEIAFRPGEDRWVYGYPGTSGAIGIAGGAKLNLHEPGTARAFLDEALALGWRPLKQPVVEHVDGWTLFDAVADRRRLASPGAAEPGS